ITLPPPDQRAQAFSLWVQATNLDAQRHAIAAAIERVLADNPFTTLQVVLAPTSAEFVNSLSPRLLHTLTPACQARPTYLDKFYALQPGRTNGAKRLIALLPGQLRTHVDADWLAEIGASATIVWRGRPGADAELEPYEYTWQAADTPVGSGV